MKPYSTSNLMNILQSSEGEALLHTEAIPEAPAFADMLKSLVRMRRMSVSNLIVAAGISKTYSYQLLRGERRAGRDTVLRIAIALQLAVNDTQKLLTLSENSILYPRIRRDAAIIFALGRQMSLTETEELLAGLPERTLYGGET